MVCEEAAENRRERSEAPDSALQAEVERLAPVDSLDDLFRREHELKCVDDVLASLVPCSALAHGARNTVNTYDDPPVCVRLVVRDGQP